MSSDSRWAWSGGAAAVCVLLVGWLWPIGVGGAMPVGGDVTSFQIGLMAVLDEALAEGRLPLWNDRWGFGFPGVAESQMGVYYPPHATLYGLLGVEAAYTASMVLHVLWGGLGARWAARRFGASEAGAVLSGVSWGASGFFLIHLPHQWAYTVGSWTPWAWGLGWSILSGSSGRKAPWLLSAVLAVQILPGHFQLAFCTQVGLLAMAAGSVLSGVGGRRAAMRRSALVALPMAGAFLLASAQVVPTFQLARLAETQRDYEYLSGFASTPLHLVSLVAPELFHRSPLWRPIAWDPFHTSPEENLVYVGLVPLFLALGAIARPGPSAGAVRVLVVVLAAGLVLGLGPYVPGFVAYSRWPGFSFFRGPARWGIVATLALSILAGLGFDAVRRGDWRRPGISLVMFVFGAGAWIGLVLGLFELAIRAGDRPVDSGIITAYQLALDARPWDDGVTVVDLLGEARRPRNDLHMVADQENAGLPLPSATPLRFDRDRVGIYRAELSTTAGLMLAAVGLALLSGRRGAFSAGLLALAVVDLGLLARRRPIDEAPIRPLAEQSAVLGALSRMPVGTRTIDPMQNLAMVAGVSPVLSYRTLDLPVQPGLSAIAQVLPRDAPEAGTVLDAQRALGARGRVIGPISPGMVPGGIDALADRFDETGRLESVEVVDDPALTGWMLGTRFSKLPAGRAVRFLLLDAGPTPRAWFLPSDLADAGRLRASRGEPGELLDLLADARPLVLRSRSPEHLELDMDAEGPGTVAVAQLDYPEWHASWVDPAGDANPMAIDRVLGGWQGVRVQGPGRRTLRLDYEGRAERWGLVISAVSWSAWGLGLALSARRGRRSPRAGAPA
ncbi:hypothetical protein [Tautonia plasticadhaerens]|uniref:hypothetical protein n=1 Tax=Tautonia plasticadhaerens TaxID=2527974 RepID=UPI0011A36234|nr:hypothetical protein [Tautonia plasticadhaerens]